MGKEKRTGLVCTVEAVPEGHQVGIAWMRNAIGQQIGFAYDEDETPRSEIKGKSVGFCEERSFGVAGHLADLDWDEEMKIEEMSADMFFGRFGGYPEEAGLFFDGWGRPDDFRKAYGVPAGSECAEMDAYKRRSNAAGIKAGAAAFGVFLAVAVAFAALSIAISGQMPVSVSAYTLLAVVLMCLGVMFVVSEMQNVSRHFYRKFMKQKGGNDD